MVAKKIEPAKVIKISDTRYLKNHLDAARDSVMRIIENLNDLRQKEVYSPALPLSGSEAVRELIMAELGAFRLQLDSIEAMLELLNKKDNFLDFVQQ